jgi:hypothetical protein
MLEGFKEARQLSAEIESHADSLREQLYSTIEKFDRDITLG